MGFASFATGAACSLAHLLPLPALAPGARLFRRAQRCCQQPHPAGSPPGPCSGPPALPHVPTGHARSLSPPAPAVGKSGPDRAWPQRGGADRGGSWRLLGVRGSWGCSQPPVHACGVCRSVHGRTTGGAHSARCPCCLSMPTHTGCAQGQVSRHGVCGSGCHQLSTPQQPAGSRASRWLGCSPESFLVPLPAAVAPSRDTGAGLPFFSGCFPACQASRVGSCCDFPDGCLAPASSPSGWASSWSTVLGQCITSAPAPLPNPMPHLQHPAPVPGLRPPARHGATAGGMLGQAAVKWGCERGPRASSESRQGQEVWGETRCCSVGWLGQPDWLGESGPGGQHGRRLLSAAAGGRASSIGAAL